jgi:outer membrane immunogenic protein
MRLTHLSAATLGCAAILFLHPPAGAQERPGNWQGVYIGGHLGAAVGSARSANTSGFVAGGHIGVNGQFDRVILGVEADVAATSNGNNGFGQKFRQGTNGSMRARVGYSFDRMMVYGTGGIAVSNYEFKNAAGKDSSMQSGAVFGAGAEVMLTPNVSVRGELLRYQFSSRSYASIGGQVSVAPTNNVLRGGMSYKF